MQANCMPADCKDAGMASMQRPSRLPVSAAFVGALEDTCTAKHGAAMQQDLGV